jgi:hypothetical protein
MSGPAVKDTLSAGTALGIDFVMSQIPVEQRALIRVPLDEHQALGEGRIIKAQKGNKASSGFDGSDHDSNFLRAPNPR